MKLPSTRFSRIILMALLAASPATVRAGVHTWKGGGGDNLWSNEDNWSSGGSPMDDDSEPRVLIFPASAQSYHTECDVSYFRVDVMYIRGSYTFSHTDNGDDNTLFICAHPADNIVIDSAASPTVMFDPSFLLSFSCNASRARLRMTSGTLRIRGFLSATITMEGSGDVSCEGGKGLNADIILRGLKLHLNKTPNIAGITRLAASQGASVLVEKSEQLRGAQVSLDGVAVVFSGGIADWLGPLTLSNSSTVNALAAGASAILFNDVTGAAGANSLLGNFDLGGVVRNFDVPDAASSLAVLGTLRDGIGPGGVQTGGIRKRGPGSLRLPNPNTFKGPVIIEDGEVIAENGTSFGTTAGGVTVQSGASLRLKAAAVGTEALTLGGWLGVSDGASSWAGPVVLPVTAPPIGVLQGSSLRLSGAVSGPGTLMLINGGTLELAGAFSNTYSGETVLDSGLLRLNKSSGLAIPGPLTVKAAFAEWESRVMLDDDQQIASNATVLLVGRDATLDLNSHTQTIGALFSLPGGALSGGGRIWMGNSRTGTAVFTVGQNDANTLYDGVITGAPGMTLVKTGTGTLRLGVTASGVNSYSGATRIDGGVLWVENGQRVGAVTVKPTGVLAGAGECGIVALDGGRICLTHMKTGSLFSAATGGEVLADYAGVLPSPVATPFQMKVQGTVNLAHTNFLTFSFAPPLFLPQGASVVIIDNDGTDPVQGNFTTFAEGAQVIWGTRQFSLTYHGGDGNDVALNLIGWGGKPLISSFTYDRAADAIHLRAQAQAGIVHQWQVSSDLQSWSTFASGTPNSSGILQYDGTLGLHAPSLFFRLATP